MGTDSRAAGALLARASTLHLQTGNLLNWGRLRKKCPSTHSEEVSTVGAEGLFAVGTSRALQGSTRPGGTEVSWVPSRLGRCNCGARGASAGRS